MVLGVSKDPPEAQRRFREKNGLPFHLLSDPDARVMKAWGVWKEKTLYGKKSMGAERTTVIVDPAGKVEKIFRNVKVDGHAAEVLAAL